MQPQCLCIASIRCSRHIVHIHPSVETVHGVLYSTCNVCIPLSHIQPTYMHTYCEITFAHTVCTHTYSTYCTCVYSTCTHIPMSCNTLALDTIVPEFVWFVYSECQ